MMKSRIVTFVPAALLVLGTHGVRAEGGEAKFAVPEKAEALLENYCYECHESGIAKGGVKFDNLAALNHGERLDLLNLAVEHVYSGEMPPKKADRPSEEERQELIAWFTGVLKEHNAYKLEDKLRYYKYANYLDHDKLFSGEIKDKPYTRARRWRVNELIYHERINDVFGLTDRGRRAEFFGVVKPFNLPSGPGVTYYDTEAVEGGQLLTLLSNAEWVAGKQLRPALEKSGEFKHPEGFAEAMKSRGGRASFPDEHWNLKSTAEPLAKIILAKEVPDDEVWTAAIHHQFQVALQRQATPDEIDRYLDLVRKTLKESDKTGALKNVLVSVLMEPEFIYRSEFGDGKPDADGRSKLTPREASYAIAYALTDSIPDASLVEAAKSGRLQSKEDYEREVRRMLADKAIAKPRILRFFQDYFGYMNVYNVFKDEERFIGHYNPHRAFSRKYVWRMPGMMRDDADTLVKWALERDQNVFETLLTTDRFFVHHNGDNAAMQAAADAATRQEKEDRKLYKELLKMEPKQHEAYLKSVGRPMSRRMQIDLESWRLRFGPDGTKGEDVIKVAMPRLPDIARHMVKVWNIDHTLWSYEPQQPMKVENRTGILTHPAWLVANSQNAATDPIHRGKFVREQLLGGFIRDVPITVDAKVPEYHDQTLRERFAVSEAKKCWQCHEKMNPLGYVFEEYDDFGRFRREEALEFPENIIEEKKVREKGPSSVYIDYQLKTYKTKPVDTSGYLEGTGDPKLDGPVKDTRDLITRLAKSDRVRQVFIRNVFRFLLGRNETYADSQTLIAADKAYLESGGSFNELIVSILTSDSFIYRKSP